MAPDCRMLCDGNAGLKRRYDLRQSAPDASDEIPIHYRDGGVRHQRAAGAEDPRRQKVGELRGQTGPEPSTRWVRSGLGNGDLLWSA